MEIPPYRCSSNFMGNLSHPISKKYIKFLHGKFIGNSTIPDPYLNIIEYLYLGFYCPLMGDTAGWCTGTVRMGYFFSGQSGNSKASLPLSSDAKEGLIATVFAPSSSQHSWFKWIFQCKGKNGDSMAITFWWILGETVKLPGKYGWKNGPWITHGGRLDD